jgi:2-keto-4-pentenoate hydratase/2-oxohepta-3-ene-1,7-dioic acid hydratase in catechol pathway
MTATWFSIGRRKTENRFRIGSRMKLAMILYEGRPSVAIIDAQNGLYWLLSDALPGLPARMGHDMVAVIGHMSHLPGIAMPALGGRSLKGARLLAPVPAPPHNIMCVGKNYRAHAHEFSRSGFDAGSDKADAIPEFPIIFTKPSGAISGPTDDIPLWPGLDAAVDYEAELAVVIGRGGRAISRAQALSHVFGYTIINDVTARDLQRDHKQWFLGKGIDGFGPMGPWIVTADEIDGGDLRVSCRVNGEIRQDSSTADLIFDVPTLIETISKSVTLCPGDIIATGTPEGVGIGFNPPRFLSEGDVVEVEIAGIGVLRNVVRRAAADATSSPLVVAAEK